MGQDNLPVLKLDAIQEQVKLSRGKAKQLMETCIWCLLHCDHSNGVKFRVENENNKFYYSVVWPTEIINIETINRSYNKYDAVEDGAEALALLITAECTEYTAVERAITTTGIDYWLGFKNRNPNHPFHRTSRLEISGILRETATNSVNGRVREKLKQTIRSDTTTFPVYVIIVEFSQPYAFMVLKHVNSKRITS